MSSGVPVFFAKTRLYVAIRRRLSATPRRFERPLPLADWQQGREWRHRKIVFPETDLVVEGFPGSGNSFVANSLHDATRERYLITSHFHHTVQLKRALAFGVPALVVVRGPLAAANSLKSKEPAFWDGLILARWILYHRFVLKHIDRLEVFLFDEVTRDLDLIRRECVAVRQLLDTPLVPNPAHRRASETRVEIGSERFTNRCLLRLARSLYGRIASANPR